MESAVKITIVFGKRLSEASVDLLIEKVQLDRFLVSECNRSLELAFPSGAPYEVSGTLKRMLESNGYPVASVSVIRETQEVFVHLGPKTGDVDISIQADKARGLF